jgi:uncharacterized membrane protein YGL010W
MILLYKGIHMSVYCVCADHILGGAGTDSHWKVNCASPLGVDFQVFYLRLYDVFFNILCVIFMIRKNEAFIFMENK